MIDRWSGHRIIVGRTGSGKTYHAVEIMQNRGDCASVFINTAHHEESYFPNYFIHISKHDVISDITRALKKRKPLVYTPDLYQTSANKELEVLKNYLMSDRPFGLIRLFIDEVQRFAPQGSIDTACHVLATGGRRWDIECYFITQRLADVSKTIVTQCSEWIIHNHSSIDRDYLKQRGIILNDEDIELLESNKWGYLTKNA